MRRNTRGSALSETGVASAALILIGLAYFAINDDLIPDNQPYGLADDAVFMVLCLAAALYWAPMAARGRVVADALFRVRVLRADLGNFGPVQHRYVDGFLISGKNSGSHWVKYMLSLALAERYDLEPPRFTSGREADRIVGRASRSRSGRAWPQIATSHTIPSWLLAALPLPRAVRQPPVVLLVRDIPDALASGYRKWSERYRVSLSEFARGDPSGRRYIADVWWYAHFFNRWGLLHRRQPRRVMLVHYEQLLADPPGVLRRIAAHFGLDCDAALLDRAVALAGKDRMRALQDPDAGETIVPEVGAPPAWSAEDLASIAAVLRRHLRNDLGYSNVGTFRQADAATSRA